MLIVAVHISIAAHIRTAQKYSFEQSDLDMHIGFVFILLGTQ